MLRDELRETARPFLADAGDHPFWAGLRTGSLPPACLWYFAEQDTHYTVPAYARALTRAAAVAERDADSALLCSAASETFAAAARMAESLPALATELGAAPRRKAEIGPVTHAHTSFLLAAPATSFGAALGGLLPMTWFHQVISQDLVDRCVPGTRYEEWISYYRPGSAYEDFVEGFLTMVDEVGEQLAPAERAALDTHFLRGADYEMQFAESAWRLQSWS